MVDSAMQLEKHTNINILTASAVPVANSDWKLRHSSPTVLDLPTATTGTSPPYMRIGIALRFQFGRFVIGCPCKRGSFTFSTFAQKSSSLSGDPSGPRNLRRKTCGLYL
eukprot:6882974-Pyramimonas_sp.AAC.1